MIYAVLACTQLMSFLSMCASSGNDNYDVGKWSHIGAYSSRLAFGGGAVHLLLHEK